MAPCIQVWIRFFDFIRYRFCPEPIRKVSGGLKWKIWSRKSLNRLLTGRSRWPWLKKKVTLHRFMNCQWQRKILAKWSANRAGQLSPWGRFSTPYHLKMGSVRYLKFWINGNDLCPWWERFYPMPDMLLVVSRSWRRERKARLRLSILQGAVLSRSILLSMQKMSSILSKHDPWLPSMFE